MRLRKKWMLMTGIVMIAALMIGLVVIVTPNTVPTAPVERTTPTLHGYRVIGEWEGKVAVFLPQSSSPEIVYDTKVSTLPTEARLQLQDGVEVKDIEELKRRLEDYLS